MIENIVYLTVALTYVALPAVAYIIYKTCLEGEPT